MIDKTNNLVSVIVPAYNAESTIAECIESVCCQSYKDWEMIIVNDASSDSTSKILSDYSKRDSRIKVYSQDINQGVSAARNKAIELSKGRYIAFLDSDDFWKKDKLKKQLKFMHEKQIGFSMTSYEIISDNNINGKIFRVPESIDYVGYLKNTIIGNLTVILDQEIVGPVKVEKGPLEDVMTWMKLLKNGSLAYGLDENLATYRIVENSVSSDKVKNAKLYFKSLRERQNISIIKSIYYFLNYVVNALLKRYI